MSTWNHCPLAWLAPVAQRVLALPSIAFDAGFVPPASEALATQPARDSVVSASVRLPTPEGSAGLAAGSGAAGCCRHAPASSKQTSATARAFTAHLRGPPT